MPNVVIEEGAEVRRVIIAEGVRIGKGVKLGSKDGEIELIAQDRL
jgi:glucose-1-phosphate adenylyltransferase